MPVLQPISESRWVLNLQCKPVIAKLLTRSVGDNRMTVAARTVYVSVRLSGTKLDPVKASAGPKIRMATWRREFLKCEDLGVKLSGSRTSQCRL